MKKRSSKSRKIDIFPKGLTHRFAQKLAIFPFFFFFQAVQARKMCFMILQNEKTHLQGIKTRSSKSRKIDIFRKGLTHGFAQKLAIFPSFFLANIVQENVFYDILERTNAFLGNKGVNPWFCSKIGHFFTFFFLGNIGQEKVFYILERKNAFLGNKNKKYKKTKNEHFSTKVNQWFCSKIGNFSILFFLGNIGQENEFYDILERKNAFLGNKNKKFKKSKN